MATEDRYLGYIAWYGLLFTAACAGCVMCVPFVVVVGGEAWARCCGGTPAMVVAVNGDDDHHHRPQLPPLPLVRLQPCAM